MSADDLPSSAAHFQSHRNGAAPPHVLVVEDEPTIRDVLVMMLEDEGYDVRQAVHGREALEILRTWSADVVLLDMMLPILDGQAFLAEKWRLGIAPDTRVVVVSASRRAVAEGARSLGVDAVVSKPFDLGALLDTIERVLAQPARPA